jgi:hypothetical protein
MELKKEKETKESDTTVELKNFKDSVLSSSSSKINKSAKKSQHKINASSSSDAKADATAMKKNFYQNAKKKFADFEEIVFTEASLTIKLSWEVRNVNNIGVLDRCGVIYWVTYLFIDWVFLICTSMLFCVFII